MRWNGAHLCASSSTRICSTCERESERTAGEEERGTVTHDCPSCLLLRDNKAGFGRSEFGAQVTVDLVEVGEDEMLLVDLGLEFRLLRNSGAHGLLLCLKQRFVRLDNAQGRIAVALRLDSRILQDLELVARLAQLLLPLLPLLQQLLGRLRAQKLEFEVVRLLSPLELLSPRFEPRDRRRLRRDLALKIVLRRLRRLTILARRVELRLKLFRLLHGLALSDCEFRRRLRQLEAEVLNLGLAHLGEFCCSLLVTCLFVDELLEREEVAGSSLFGSSARLKRGGLGFELLL